MKNKNIINSKKIIIWALAAVPLIIVAYFYNALPERVPVHWGLDGSVEYGGRITIWLMAGMGVLFAILFPVFKRIDPRSQNYNKFSKYYEEFQIFMMLFFIVLTSVVVSESLNPGKINVEMAVIIMVGTLFAVIGNMMPKFKNNFFVGIKTPWTLSNEKVWNKTHRLGGIMWFFGGIIIMVSPFVINGEKLFYLVMTVTAVITLVPIIMSYVWYIKTGK